MSTTFINRSGLTASVLAGAGLMPFRYMFVQALPGRSLLASEGLGRQALILEPYLTSTNNTHRGRTKNSASVQRVFRLGRLTGGYEIYIVVSRYAQKVPHSTVPSNEIDDRPSSDKRGVSVFTPAQTIIISGWIAELMRKDQ